MDFGIMGKMYPAPLGGWGSERNETPYERKQRMEETRIKDLDETRRVGYMALLRPRTEKYELAATVVNALAHHRQVTESTDEVIELVVDAIHGDANARAWVRQQIDSITEELG